MTSEVRGTRLDRGRVGLNDLRDLWTHLARVADDSHRDAGNSLFASSATSPGPSTARGIQPAKWLVGFDDLAYALLRSVTDRRETKRGSRDQQAS